MVQMPSLEMEALLEKGRGGFTFFLHPGSCSLFLWVVVKGYPLEEGTRTWFPLSMGLPLHAGKV